MSLNQESSWFLAGDPAVAHQAPVEDVTVLIGELSQDDVEVNLPTPPLPERGPQVNAHLLAADERLRILLATFEAKPRQSGLVLRQPTTLAALQSCGIIHQLLAGCSWR